MARLEAKQATWHTITGHPGTSPAWLAKMGRGMERWARRKAQRQQAAEARRAARRRRP